MADPKALPLFFTSHNESQTTTIVLIHGLTDSHREWDLIVPYLSNYHLLIPDLPAHSRSKHIKPYTTSSATSHIASLIRSHAHNGKAHVVGLSLGGFVGKEIARSNPELVHSLFVTGAAEYQGRQQWFASRPGLIYFINSLRTGMPLLLSSRVEKWIGVDISPEFAADQRENTNSELTRQGFGQILETGQDVELSVRTMAVAGGKQDDVEATRKQGAIFKKGCSESRAFVVEQAIHAWNVQTVLVEVFANGIKAWIEGTKLPEEYKELI